MTKIFRLLLRSSLLSVVSCIGVACGTSLGDAGPGSAAGASASNGSSAGTGSSAAGPGEILPAAGASGSDGGAGTSGSNASGGSSAGGSPASAGSNSAGAGAGGTIGLGGTSGLPGVGGSPGSGRSAMQIVSEMGLGWNLGNTLDSTGVKDETGWGAPKTTQAMINAVKSGGFTTLRVPTSWDDHSSGSSDSIDPAWLNRVEEVANYGLSAGMYVIVNVHHQNGWESTTAANEANAKDHLTKLWTQIAAHFRKYGDHLIFETMNEPRNAEDWTGKQEYYDVINHLNDAAVKTIRADGGNNVTRLIMVPGYVASPQAMQINALLLPNDKMLAVSTHSYIPYGFALDSTGTASFSNTSEIDTAFSRLNTMFVSKGIPVVMGEWASTNKNNLSDRVKHAAYYVKAAKAAGFPCIWWDNQNFVPNASDAMGLFDRKALSWKFPEILKAMMDAAK